MGEIEIESSRAIRVDEVWLKKRESPLLSNLLITVRYRFYRLYRLKCSNADLQSELQCDCYQYANDTTFHIHSKPCDLDSSADYLNNAVTSLRDNSKNCNLALTSSKTNCMLLSTPQMARYHSTIQKLPTACDRYSTKMDLLHKATGCMRRSVTWAMHVDLVLRSSYGTLSSLRWLKNLAPFHARKHLAESLALCKANYAYSVFNPLPACADLSQEGSQV